MSARTISPSRIGRFNVLGTGFSLLNPQRAVEEIRWLIESGQTGYVTVTNADGVVRSLQDESLRQIYNQSFLTTPDGMPVVWTARLRGHAEVARVYGPDLMLRLFLEGRRRGWRHFLYGGKEGVAGQLQQALELRFPSVQIVGTHTPPFTDLTEQEEDRLIEEVAELKPDLFWVGVSSPRQDRFMARMVGRLDAGVLLGVGAAFDFHSGQVSQAPVALQDAGLEWAYRLGREPRRLWSRYASTVPRFLFHSVCQATGLRHYPKIS